MVSLQSSGKAAGSLKMKNKNLVDLDNTLSLTYNIMRVYSQFGEFLDKPLSLVERKKLSNADTDKGCGSRVTELSIHLGDRLVL